MAYRLELSDLPPRYRAQAEAQLAGRGKKRGDTVTAAARAAAMSGLKFDSRGEYEYYVGTVAPKVGRGEIVKWEAHPCFLLFPAGEYNGVKLRSVQYTADFRLTYADGTVEIVEVKSKFVRRMQRDYPVPAAPKAGDCGRHGVLAGIRRGRHAPPCDGQHGAGRRAECAVRGVLPHVRAVLREAGGGA